MVIGFGNWGFQCAVAAFHAFAALDPAYGVAELPGHTDVMIVALRDVQCVVQAVTVAAVDGDGCVCTGPVDRISGTDVVTAISLIIDIPVMPADFMCGINDAWCPSWKSAWRIGEAAARGGAPP